MAYNRAFDSPLLRGVDIDPRPWDLQAEILANVHSYDNLLDVGCGTAAKLIPIAEAVRNVVGLEPNADMRSRAIERIAEAALANVLIVEGNGEELPFSDNSFDVATYMMAPVVASEAHRVLKPGGVAILEELGEQDKNVIKACFTPDESGKRGLLADLQPNKQAVTYQTEFEDAEFSQVAVRSGFWSTLLTPEGLDLLLTQTPTIRNFDPIKDQESVQRAKERCLTTEGFIKITQHRLLIIATK